MACCKCCCGEKDCAEGDQGKCCCGGAQGTCCDVGEFCCNGVCSPNPCCNAETCPPATAAAYKGRANMADIPDACFAGGEGWTNTAGNVIRDWEWISDDFYCTPQEAINSADGVLAGIVPTLTGACKPSLVISSFLSFFAERRCVDGVCRWVSNDNDPAAAAAIEQCVLAEPP